MITTRGGKRSDKTSQFLVGLAAVTREIRRNNRLSQADVASHAGSGIGRRFVSAVEHGRTDPTVSQLEQLAQGLGLAGVPELWAKAEDAARDIAKSPLTTASQDASGRSSR